MVFYTKLTLEQHGFELIGSTYMQVFFNKYSTVNAVSLYDFRNIIFSFIVRIQYIIHIQNICYMFMLLVRLPVNSRLLEVKFWGNQKLHIDF